MENKTFDRSNCDPLFDEVVAYAREQKRLTACGAVVENGEFVKDEEGNIIHGNQLRNITERKRFIVCNFNI